ncbi:hypothetical protein [Horticoccus sp. 23ND18S-11]|uniref:hypothetical protein n=1 Tax=Horticoccus sp. 23ND18S-11 TaxID=3391832 RepID=UPI0039C9F12B
MTSHSKAEANEKQLEPIVQRAIATVRSSMSTRKPNIREAFSYGAIGIDPKHLVVWYIFSADADKSLATRSGFSKELDFQSRVALRTEGYPAPAVDQISVAFASDEEIKRAGGLRAFFA